MKMVKMDSPRVAGQVLKNCFLTVSAPIGDDIPGERSPERYFELRRTVVDSGISEELVEVDYPITKEYVNSFADSADYRVDPLSKVRPNGGKNLGDIVDLQNMTAMDMQAARTAYDNLKAVFERLSAKKVPSDIIPSEEEGKK